MTLLEKIQKKSEEYGQLASIFLEGAKFALENQWISTKYSLPCNHEELLNAKYQIKEIFISKYEGFPDVDYMLNTGGKWMWFKYKNPEFWMPVPELPKEYGLNYEKRNR